MEELKKILSGLAEALSALVTAQQDVEDCTRNRWTAWICLESTILNIDLAMKPI
jgi:hypothetical protein